jgi:hypothetical protein
MQYQGTFVTFLVPDSVGDITLTGEAHKDLLGTQNFEQTKENLAAVGILAELAAKVAK